MAGNKQPKTKPKPKPKQKSEKVSPKQKPKQGPKEPTKQKQGRRGAPDGNRNAAKDDPAFLKATHAKLLDHLRRGKSWDTFGPLGRQAIRKYKDANNPDFPWPPIEEACREGLSYLEDLIEDGARGKISGFNARAALFRARNKGLGMEEAKADIDYTPPLPDGPLMPLDTGNTGPVNVRVTYELVTKEEAQATRDATP